MRKCTFLGSMPKTSCLQVLYEFHLSAAWGTMWRISPNGLVCNCSVNTCLSSLGECGGKKAPYSNTLKPLIEQPITIYLLTVAGREGGPARQEGLFGSLHHHQDYVAAAAACLIRVEEAEAVAKTEDREVCVYMEQVVLSWLPVFAGSGCVCAACCCKALLPLWNLGVDRAHLGPGRASSLLFPHMYTYIEREGETEL